MQSPNFSKKNDNMWKNCTLYRLVEDSIKQELGLYLQKVQKFIKNQVANANKKAPIGLLVTPPFDFLAKLDPQRPI